MLMASFDGQSRQTFSLRARLISLRQWLVPLVVACGTLAGGAWAAIPVSARTSAPAPNAAPLVGNPPTEKFTPNIEVDSQNFCIVQDSRGIVFVCNGDGVIEFDGERWKLHKMPNREMVRSLAVDAEDNLYVGGYNLFGVLRRDLAGTATLEDYSHRFMAKLAGREFADIWDIENTPEGVYFRALNDVFLVNFKTNAIAHWYHEGKFGVLRHHAGRTITQFRGEGLKVKEGDTWRLLPATAAIKEPVFHALPLADKSLLIFGNETKWWRLTADTVTIQAMPPGTPEPSTILSATVLPDGSLTFAGSEGKVFNIDNQLKKTRAFKLEAGVISGVAKEVGGGVLAVADLAIYRVAWPSRWSMLGIEQGGGGPLVGFAQWNDKRYALSDAGGFEIIENIDGQLSFAPVPWNKNSIYALHPLSKTRALLSGTHRLLMVDNNVATEIASELLYPRNFWPSRFHPGRVYLGTEAGLRLLDTRAEKIAISAAIPSQGLVQFQSIAELSKNEIWLGTERHGVWRVQLADDGGVISATQIKAAKDSLGLKYGQFPSAYITHLKDGTVLASTGAGIFAWNGKQFVQAAFDGLVAMRAADETLALAQAPDGTLWAHSKVRLWKQDSQKKWVQQDIQNIRKGSINDIAFDTAGNTILVNSHGLVMHHMADIAALAKKPAHMQLRSVTQTLADGTSLPLPITPTVVQQFKIADSALRFEFALPDYAREGARRYQGRLVGDEPAFSEWAVAASYSYSALPAGQYIMQIRARDGEGNVTAMPDYPFEILPIWYRRVWAMVMWLLLVITAIVAVVFALVRRRTLALERRNLSLERKVAARTSELEIANTRLEAIARLDGLTGVPNRRCLDEFLEQAWVTAQQTAQPLGLLIIDVDHFKQYNDQYGHQAGDVLLRQIATCLSDCVSRHQTSLRGSSISAGAHRSALLARYGGEEFVAVLPDTSLELAAALAETMRHMVETHVKTSTVSIGAASYAHSAASTSSPTMPDVLLSAADSALYAAKAAGRNCVRTQ